jgi:phosphatidylglycerophosphate synthase
MKILKTDLIINKKIVEPCLFLFKHIHPNMISLFGIFLNYIIFNSYYKNYNKILIVFLTFIRIYCDNLDGMVARKFNKVSKFGGLLDTIDDMILCTIACYMSSYGFIPSYALYLSIFFGLSCTYYLFYNDSLFIHANFFGKKETSFFDRLALLMGNNTFLFSLLWSIFLI